MYKRQRLAYANTFWTYIDAENGLPVRLEAKDTDAYRGKDGKMESKLDMEYAPRKIVLPEDYEQQDSFAVQKHHLDTNHHVNNCQYVQMAMDYLPENFKIHQMRAEYKQQARLNDVIDVYKRQIFDHLFQTCCDRKAATAWIDTIKHIKNYSLIGWVLKIALHHG